MKYLRPSITLLLVTILAYGLLIPRLGFYWDDLPITWIRYELGPEALTRYFSTNRPVWGVLHQATTRLLPQAPLAWQVFALFWRWLCAVTVFAIAEKLWRGMPRFALGVALLFLVYPGFDQHWAAYLYSHFYIVLFFFLLSLLCALLALDAPRRSWAWALAGLCLSALNLWMMEYFYVLELARVGIILVALRGEPLELRARVVRTMKLWMPYLALFVLAVLSRLFIFNNQTYGINLAGQLKSAPVETLKSLAGTIAASLWVVSKDAWWQALDLRNVTVDASALRTYAFVVGSAALVSTVGFLLLPRDGSQSFRGRALDALWVIGLGAWAAFLAGWPFWLVGFNVSLAWPASRFTLPFTLGVGFLLGGFIHLIPWERARIVALVALVACAAGRQYLTSLEYARDWAAQKDLFWQLMWRAPGIQPHTLVMMNDNALEFYADNSLSSALNWIYARDGQIEYALIFPTSRLGGSLPKLEAGLPIHYNYLAGDFNGTTSQALAMYYAPPGCVRILDPFVDRTNRLIPEPSLMRYAARLSDPNLILNESRARMPEVYGPEPAHGFCYYFEKADLARQVGDWQRVAQLADDALSFDAHPYDPAERFVFIEGYAHAGQWGRAVELSNEAYGFSSELGRTLCQLWKRIETETTGGVERSEALSEVKRIYACTSE